MKLDLKKVELDLLIQFDKICRENSLRYSLSDGTLLGAIRHKGFIPWDDDIDVIMPRADYERLLSLDNSNKEITIYHYKNNRYFYPFAKMCDNRYRLFESYRPEKCLGPYIDIFPLDYLPDDKRKRERVIKQAYKDMRIMFAVTGSYYSYYRDKKTKIRKKIFYFFQRFFINESIKKRYLQHYEKKYSMFSGHKIANLMYTEKNGVIMDENEFDNLKEIEFESHRFLSITDYHSYLTMQYGDYMTLPKKEDRKSNHNFIIEE